MSQRFLFVDGLRGLAALGVVIYHIVNPHFTPNLVSAYPLSGPLAKSVGYGVAVFFALSGYVIAHSLYDYVVTPNVAGRFMLRRAIRLDPTYWAALAVTLGAAFASHAMFNRPLPNLSADFIAAHIFYLQFLLGYKETINPVSWTLCLELQFYLIFAFLLMLRSRAVWFLAFSISLLWPLSIANSEAWAQTFFLPLWHTFLLGAASYWATRDPELVVPATLYAFLIFTSSVITQNWFSLVCVLTAAALYVAAKANYMGAWLRWRPLQFLGSISYSLYIIHAVGVGLTFRIGNQVLGRGLYSELACTLAAIIVSIILATLMWLIVERPSLRLSKVVTMRSAAARVRAGTQQSAREEMKVEATVPSSPARAKALSGKL